MRPRVVPVAGERADGIPVNGNAATIATSSPGGSIRSMRSSLASSPRQMSRIHSIRRSQGLTRLGFAVMEFWPRSGLGSTVEPRK